MNKKIFGIGLIAFLALAGVSVARAVATPQSGANDVVVTSCENVSNGIRISRDNHTPYVLTNGVRDAGHGLRNYSLSCVSNTKYHVAWTAAAQSADTTDPSVSLYSEHSSYYTDEAYTVLARASDNSRVSKIEVYRNNNLIKTCLNVNSCTYIENANTYTYSSSITYHAKAYDPAGNTAQSQTMTINIAPRNIDTTAPSVSISSNKNSYYSNETVTITARASDAHGIRMIEIYKPYNNGGVAKTCYSMDVCAYSEGPYAYSNGTAVMSFYAKAYDMYGNVAQSGTVDVTIYSYSYQDTSAPSATLSGTIDINGYATLRVVASDSENAIRKIELYWGSASVPWKQWSDQGYTSSYISKEFTGTLPTAVPNDFYAKVYDAAGNIGYSNTITLRSQDNDDAPGLSLRIRRTYQEEIEQVKFVASASDNTGVVRVDILAGPNRDDLRTIRRCRYSSSSTNVECSVMYPSALLPSGYYFVRAWDSAGNTRTIDTAYFQASSLSQE